MLSSVRSPSISDSRKNFSENITLTSSIIMGYTIVALKGRSTGSVKTKRQSESERKSILDRHPIIGQQVVQQQVHTLAEVLDMPPELAEQLLDTGQKSFSFRFLFVFGPYKRPLPICDPILSSAYGLNWSFKIVIN